MVEIKQFVWDIVNSNSWLMVDGNCGLLIDVVNSACLFETIADLDELTIILTHSHFDHIVGLNQIRKIKQNITVISTQKCSENIENKYRNMSASATAFMTFYNKSGTEIEPFICKPAEITFENEKKFLWREYKIKLESFFGHSNDSLVATIDDKFLFSGDTILSIPTVTRFPGGSTAKFWEEDIPRLQKMNIEMVFPGHGASGNLTDMIKINIHPEKDKRG